MNRIVSLTLSLEATTSKEDAVSQFIKAIALYGMGSFDFQVFEDEDEMSYVSGREAMIEMDLDLDEEEERQEEREDDVRAEVRSDLLNEPEDEEADDGRPAP